MNNKGGIRRRWAVNSLLPAIFVLISAFFVFVLTTSNYYYGTMLSQLQNKAVTTASFFNRYLISASDFYSMAKNFTNEFTDKDFIEMQTVSLNGSIIYSSSGIVSGYAPGTPDSEETIRTMLTKSYKGTDSLTKERVISVSTPLFNADGTLAGVFRLVTSLRGVDEYMLTIISLFLLVTLLIFCLIMWTNIYFLKTIVTPLRVINETAKKLAAGKYEEKIKNIYNDEIGELSETINFMSTEISRTEKVKNDFLSSVSHELRTPLTAITGWAETIASDNLENKTMARRGLSIIIKESGNLRAMLEELLDFSRMQSGRLVVNFGQVNVSDEIEDVCMTFGESLKQDSFELRYTDKVGELWISADRSRLRQVFVNLIDNARKHAKEGQYLDITLEKSIFREGYPCLLITFRDYGPGIPEADLPHVTEKFYKGSSRRPGSGIGLAVANEIVMLHDGSLMIRNAENGSGTVITIKLPITRYDADTEDGEAH